MSSFLSFFKSPYPVDPSTTFTFSFSTDFVFIKCVEYVWGVYISQMFLMKFIGCNALYPTNSMSCNYNVGIYNYDSPGGFVFTLAGLHDGQNCHSYFMVYRALLTGSESISLLVMLFGI